MEPPVTSAGHTHGEECRQPGRRLSSSTQVLRLAGVGCGGPCPKAQGTQDALGEQYGLLEQSLAPPDMPIWRAGERQGDEARLNVSGDFRFYRRGQALLVCDGIEARRRHDQRTLWRISQLCPRKLRRVQRPALHNQNERCRTHAGKPLNGAVSRLSSRFSPLSGPTPSSPRVFIVCRTAGQQDSRTAGQQGCWAGTERDRHVLGIIGLKYVARDAAGVIEGITKNHAMEWREGHRPSARLEGGTAARASGSISKTCFLYMALHIVKPSIDGRELVIALHSMTPASRKFPDVHPRITRPSDSGADGRLQGLHRP